MSKADEKYDSLDPTEGSMDFRTLDEARYLAKALAGICPDFDRAVVGLAELMFNAVEHGNLGVDYDEKTVLDQENRFTEEIERRLRLPEYRDRVATVWWQRTKTEIIFTIEDQGEGFDSSPYMETETDLLLDTHGRGIIMARMVSFNRLQYLGCGNRVQAVIVLPTIN